MLDNRGLVSNLEKDKLGWELRGNWPYPGRDSSRLCILVFLTIFIFTRLTLKDYFYRAIARLGVHFFLLFFTVSPLLR